MSLHFCLLTGQLLTFQLEAGKETGHADPTQPCLYHHPIPTAPPTPKDERRRDTPSEPLSKVMGLALSPLPTSLSSPHLLVPVPSYPFSGSKCPSTGCPHPPHLPSTWKPSLSPGVGGRLPPPGTLEAPPPPGCAPGPPAASPSPRGSQVSSQVSSRVPRGWAPPPPLTCGTEPEETGIPL